MALGNKHTFWQALVVALIIFWTGILIGIYFEKHRVDKVESFYFDAETEIFDFELASEIIYSGTTDLGCNASVDRSILFADKIYNQARTLEKYDVSSEITDDLFSLHRRYDLLRVMLWKNVIDNKKRCPGNVNTIVYLYQYKEPAINTKATQDTMSNFLIDLKEKYDYKIILIPIAVDTEVESLDILRDFYGLEEVPVIFVNEQFKFTTLESLKDVEKYLY